MWLCDVIKYSCDYAISGESTASWMTGTCGHCFARFPIKKNDCKRLFFVGVTLTSALSLLRFSFTIQVPIRHIRLSSSSSYASPSCISILYRLDLDRHRMQQIRGHRYIRTTASISTLTLTFSSTFVDTCQKPNFFRALITSFCVYNFFAEICKISRFESYRQHGGTLSLNGSLNNYSIVNNIFHFFLFLCINNGGMVPSVYKNEDW